MDPYALYPYAFSHSQSLPHPDDFHLYPDSVAMYLPCDDFDIPVPATAIDTFPTPSELMAELQVASGKAPLQPLALHAALPNEDSPPAPASDMGSLISVAHGMDADAAETARKARRRAMAKSVGFVPTDPDTISSHEKKRHYLECIEQYILYLHEQFNLVGQVPPPMERVATYRGLSSRSIRTLLVHMEHNTRTLNGRTVDEEQRFLALKNEIELTRNSFQGGLSAQRWLEFCRLLISKNTIPERDVATHISNSILLLFRSYPGEPTLQSYLRKALFNDPAPLVPLPTFVSTFLQAARSSDLHDPLTLTVLLQTALDRHYASTAESLIPPTDSPSTVIRTLHDSVALLRTVVAISPPSLHFPSSVIANRPHLPTLASSLFLILFSSVQIPADLHRVPLQQALSLYAELAETISVLRMSFGGTAEPDMEVVGVLETLLVSLSFVVGDEARGMSMGVGMPGIAMPAMGMALGLGIQGFAGSTAFGLGRVVSTSDGHALGQGKTDDSSEEGAVITLGLLLNCMVTYSFPTWGAGDTAHALTLLLAIYRASSSYSSRTLSVFLCQVMQVSLGCLAAQRPVASRPGSKLWLWRAFVLGRLPALVVAFAEILVAFGGDGNSPSATFNHPSTSSASNQKIDMRKALQEAALSLLRRQDLFVQVDQTVTAARARERESEMAASNSAEGAEEESNNILKTRPFLRDLLQQFVAHGILSTEIVVQVDPLFSPGFTEGGSNNHKWHAETVAPDGSADLAVFVETKIFQGQDPKEVKGFIKKIVLNDPAFHSVFAGVVNKRFTSSVYVMDVDALGQTCKILHTYDQALEVVSLHVRVYDLIFYSLLFLEEYDCETVGDPQTALSHLGDVVLFLQYALVKFKFETYEFTKDNRTVSSAPFIDVEVYLRARGRGPEDLVTYHTWHKALFDSGSEGIEDNILRATKPKILLRVALPLVLQAISHKCDKEVLMNGIAYFTGPLLNWVLVGVVKCLIREIQRGNVTPAHYEVLQTLLLSPSCPRSVLVLCSQQIALLASDNMKKKQTSVGGSFNLEMIGKAVIEALGGSGEELFVSSTSPNTARDETPGQGQIQQRGHGQVWHQSVRRAIQHAFAMVRRRRSSQHGGGGGGGGGGVANSAWSPLPPLPPPCLDLQRCLNMVRPIRFLQILWAEVQTAANLGELEVCRRIMTFALTMPLVDETCGAHQRQFPLLPLFLHIVLPGIIAKADELQPKEEQTGRVDLLVAVIPSLLNAALHLEWAMRFVSEQQQQKQVSQQQRQPQTTAAAASSPDQLALPVLGQTSSGMARRLAVDLRRNWASDVSRMILQRLATTHPFVASFPVFKSELGT